jgi:hypothetical protein
MRLLVARVLRHVSKDREELSIEAPVNGVLRLRLPANDLREGHR